MAGETRSIVILTPHELAEIVEAAMRRVLAEQPTTVERCDWLGEEDVASMLGVAPSYVRKVEGLPFHRVGRSRRYHRADVETYIRQRRSGG